MEWHLVMLKLMSTMGGWLKTSTIYNQVLLLDVINKRKKKNIRRLAKAHIFGCKIWRWMHFFFSFPCSLIYLVNHPQWSQNLQKIHLEICRISHVIKEFNYIFILFSKSNTALKTLKQNMKYISNNPYFLCYSAKLTSFFIFGQLLLCFLFFLIYCYCLSWFVPVYI